MEGVGNTLTLSNFKKWTTVDEWWAGALSCNKWTCWRPGPEVVKLFSCSTQQSTKFILLINVKMPTVVSISTFTSMINTTSERLKAKNFFTFRYFRFYEQLKFSAQLS